MKFITGNEDKYREVKELLGVEFERVKVDLPELQGTPEEISTEKAKIACAQVGEACFVDDTSLCFDEWGGLPGPYIKHFLDMMGKEKLARTLIGSGNNKAVAVTTIGYCEPGQKPVVIVGKCKGFIMMPAGENNFAKGWDQIFSPDGKHTFAQMSAEEKHAVSQRQDAIKKFKEFLSGRCQE